MFPVILLKVRIMKTFKKVSVFILTLIFCISVPFGAMAQSAQTVDTEIEYYEDGSYLVTQIESGISLFASGSKTVTKYSSYYNSDSEIQWTLYLKASFTYTGSSATCTSASPSYKIYDSAWKVTKAEVSRSGRTATGDYVVKKYWLGIITKTIPVKIIATCDNNGNIS